MHAFEPDGRNDTFRPPIVAKLKLEQFKNKATKELNFKFHLSGEQGSRQKTLINLKKEQLSKFKINFIYGFIYENFAFFLKREQKEGQSLNTRLARVCLSDSSFFSYTEIPLSCKESAMSKEFTYATNAHFGKADTYLSKQSDTKLKNKSLFVTFNYYDDRLKRVDKSKGTLLCAFTIEQIMEYFSHAIEKCYNGDTNPNVGLMNHYSVISKTSDTCTKVKKLENYICLGNSINAYVEYRDSLLGHYLYTFKFDIITSLASAIFDSKDIKVNSFALGTNEGKILKLARAYNDNLNVTHRFKIDSHTKNAVDSNPLIIDNETVYFTSGSSLVKYPINSCTIYSTCKQCLNTIDNLKCGWCSIENQNSGGCLRYEECETIAREENFKTSFKIDACPPIIEDFKPKLGPLEGNTEIEIKGENLCNANRIEKNLNYNLNVTIGKQRCEITQCTEESLFCKTTKVNSISNDPLKVCTTDVGYHDFQIEGCSTSSNKFNFIKTDVIKVTPNYGPIGGGTLVYLIGTNLNSGRKRKVNIKGSDCEEQNVNSSNLECLTKGIQIQNDSEKDLDFINKNGELVLEIDGNKYVLDDANKPEIKFEFKPNPTVLKHYPKASLRDTNTNITISGAYFTSSHHLQIKTLMHSLEGKIKKLNKCNMIDNSTLNCQLPKVPDKVRILSAQSPLTADISLIPDGDQDKSRVQSNSFQYFYYPVPKFDRYDKIEKANASINNLKKSVVVLRGENLSDQYAFQIKIIKIDPKSINGSNYVEMKLTDKHFDCKEPRVANFKAIKCNVDLSAESIDNNLFDSLWMVQVEIEDRHVFNVQIIQFDENYVESSKLLNYTMIAISIIILTVLALVTFYYLTSFKDKKLKFTKDKKFPHFNVKFKSSPIIKERSMLDSPFNRQSSQNGKFISFVLLFFCYFTNQKVCFF